MKNLVISGLLCWLLFAATGGECKIDDDTSLEWGTYRSNLYAGVRPRGIPNSLISGLLWFNSDDYEAFREVRHSCEQQDNLNKLEYNFNDLRLGSEQVIEDVRHKVKITTQFTKQGDDWWVLRVKGQPLYPDQHITTGVMFYAALEEGTLSLENTQVFKHTKEGRAYLSNGGHAELSGTNKGLGNFTMNLMVEQEGKNSYPMRHHRDFQELPINVTHYQSYDPSALGGSQGPELWNAKDYIFRSIISNVRVVSEKYQLGKGSDPQEAAKRMPLPWDMFVPMTPIAPTTNGPAHLVEKFFRDEFEFDIVYGKKGVALPSNEEITQEIGNAKLKFNEKFKQQFQLSSPFNNAEYTVFAKRVLSTLQGGIGYFYGNQLVDRITSKRRAQALAAASLNEDDEDEDEEFEELDEVLELAGDNNNNAAGTIDPSEANEEGPYGLFTSVPSRLVFPRGFYWDEGFQLIGIIQYDWKIGVEIINSWFSLIDENGWIAREQILGNEARSKVPREFQTQNPEFANPPTLFLALEEIISMKKKDKELRLYLKEIYPKLQLHYDWFRRTQRGEIKEWSGRENAVSIKEGYRWRGRTWDHCLTSGLDDYPRAKPPHIGELNVDLLSWIGVLARTLKEISKELNYNEDSIEYEQELNNIIGNIKNLHWSNNEKTYCDLSVNEFEESIHICHQGYVSLFPFITRLISLNDEEELLSTMELISNKDKLWTRYGISSLSKQDIYYKMGENYWRSPIWININYMILNGLKYYGDNKKSSKLIKFNANKIYKELRINLVENIFNQYNETGFAWENYNPDNGKGMGAKQFLGWTSLVVKMMVMPESLSGNDIAHDEL